MSILLLLRTYWKQFTFAVLTVIFVGACWTANHYHAASVQLAKDKTDLQAQITSQQAIITKQIQQVQQFNSIAAGVESEKQQTTDAGDKVRVVYKTKMASSPCAVSPVNSDVSVSLYNHASKVRSGPGDANPGKSYH
ncbi:hypothetical protein ACTVKO_09760 [Serratia nevei]|uniref:hypothetical protein n=1 Tax=Serratia nevei TaxID=2703794 RepID=UPI003FA6C366